MLFGQLQQDQQSAWNNYLNDWYNREQTAAIADIAAQTAFDTADNAAYTARMESMEESRRQNYVDRVLAGFTDGDGYLTAADWGLAEIPYATSHGAAEVTWITATANTAKNRKREEATGQHTYETALATQSKNYSFALTPLEKTRQAANATAQTGYWNSETTAANARRTSEYGAIADYRSADYAERAQEVAALAAFTKPFNTDNVGLSLELWQPLPYMQYQTQIANAKASWWNASGDLEFMQLATAKNTADTAYQSSINTAYTTWSASTALAAEVYARALATGEFTEQTGNINGLRDYLHTQADLERDWHLASTTARTNEITRVVTTNPSGYGVAGYTDSWTKPNAENLSTAWSNGNGNWGLNFTVANPSAADYTQRAVPADSVRRIGVMDRRFSGLHESKTAEQVYQESLQTAEQIYIAGEGAANVTRAGSVATANAQSAADNATTWASTLDTLSGSNPWLSFATASADVEAAYLTTLVTPTATFQSALATAEMDYAKAISNSRYIGTQQTFYQRWAEDLNSTHNSFRLSYYSTTVIYRTEGVRAVAYAASNNLSKLDGGSNGYSAPPRAEQIAAHQTPPASNAPTTAPGSTTLPGAVQGASIPKIFPLMATPSNLPSWVLGVHHGGQPPVGMNYNIPTVNTRGDGQTTDPQLTDFKDGTRRQPHRTVYVSSPAPATTTSTSVRSAPEETDKPITTSLNPKFVPLDRIEGMVADKLATKVTISSPSEFTNQFNHQVILGGSEGRPTVEYVVIADILSGGKVLRYWILERGEWKHDYIAVRHYNSSGELTGSEEEPFLGYDDPKLRRTYTVINGKTVGTVREAMFEFDDGYRIVGGGDVNISGSPVPRVEILANWRSSKKATALAQLAYDRNYVEGKAVDSAAQVTFFFSLIPFGDAATLYDDPQQYEGKYFDFGIAVAGDITFFAGFGAASKTLKGGTTAIAIGQGIIVTEAGIGLVQVGRGINDLRNERDVEAAAKFGDATLRLLGASAAQIQLLKARAQAQAVRNGVREAIVEEVVGPNGTAENLPTITFSDHTHPELAENIRQALAAGHPSVLTHGGDAAANRAASLEGVPNIPGLSRDEYPFASSREGGPGAWVGHVPPAQQNSQGGILSNFFRRNRIKPGDQYRVDTN